MQPHKNLKIHLIKNSLFLAALLLLLLGISRNGHIDVKNKAIRICYECIGIG